MVLKYPDSQFTKQISFDSFSLKLSEKFYQTQNVLRQASFLMKKRLDEK